MMIRNLLVGLPFMLLCMGVQVAFAFWGVRYFVRQSATAKVRARRHRRVAPAAGRRCW